MNPNKTFFNDTRLAFLGLSNRQLQQRRRLFLVMRSSLPLLLSLRAVQQLMKWLPPLRWLVRKTLFPHFCGGEAKEDCLRLAEKLASRGVRCTLDYSVEGEGHPNNYKSNFEEILKSIEWAAKHASQIPFVVVKLSSLARPKLMAKQQGQQALSPIEQKEFAQLEERLDALCSKAKQNHLRLFVDAEKAELQSTIDDLAKRMILEHNQNEAVVYTTFQLYRKDALKNLRALHEFCMSESVLLGVKLVRGAYMEQENLAAKQQGMPSPIHSSKEACDADYDAAVKYCLDHRRTIAFCAATHNEASTHLLVEMMNELSLKPSHPHIHFSQLYGMGDTISYELGKQGYNITKYLPYGPVRWVVPYLYRRMQENSSIRGQGERELQHIRTELKRRRQ